jgi:hypothetical protein
MSLWTFFDLLHDTEVVLPPPRCCVGACHDTVVGCITLEHLAAGGRSSERRCFCQHHAQEVMIAVGIPVRAKVKKGRAKKS